MPDHARRALPGAEPALPGARGAFVQRRRALERWDRILLSHEALRLLAACTEPAPFPRRVRLLEVGCRTGLGSRLWVRRGGVLLTAVDVGSERLSVASARVSGPTWLRRDPRYLEAPLPGAPFDRIICYPWATGAVPPDRLGRWLAGLAGLLAPTTRGAGGGGQPSGSPGTSRARPEGELLLVFYRQSQLAQKWGQRTGGQDTGEWAWAWQARFDPATRRQELHLVAFVPAGTPGRFTRIDEYLTLHVHTQETLLEAARAAGLAGAGKTAARSGSLLLYRLTRIPDSER